MADQDPITPAPEGNGQIAEEQPQASTIAQYIKDLSVESPSAPQVFQWQTQPSLDVQFGITGGKVGEDVHEIVLKIEVNAKSDNGTHFIVDLSYAGLPPGDPELNVKRGLGLPLKHLGRRRTLD